MAGSTKFINSLFVKRLLESKFQQTEVVVKKHTIDSESGYVNRLSIRYSSAQTTDATVQLIVLLRPAGQTSGDDAKKEWILLKDIMPRFVDIARRVDPAVQFIPKLVESTAEPNEALLLLDGPDNGFHRDTNADGLSLAQSQVAIEKLATFHAASVVYFAQSPADAQSAFKQGSLLGDTPRGRNFFREALTCFIANAESMQIPGSVVQKLHALQPRLLVKSADDFAASLNGFTVLNHGNVWRDNILFRADSGQPVEALLIDFKNAFIGSPVVDLMFFLTTSVAYEVTRVYKDELLYRYHTRLSETLATLRYEGSVPSLTELHIDFLKRGIFELMLTLTVAPYLRSVGCAVQPKLIPPFVNHPDLELAAIAQQVLATHAEDIIEELDVVEHNGLLDWGVESSHLKKLLMGFQ